MVAPDLAALQMGGRYSLDDLVGFFDEAGPRLQRTMTGRQLMNNLELRMVKRGTSLLVRYKQTSGAIVSPK